MTVAIIVVDDEPDVVDLFNQRFRRELKRDHCALHFANTGAEALAFMDAAEDMADKVVLMDIRLPDMSGLELMSEVKKRWPTVPAFTVTAFGDENNRQQAAAAGADEFITKPIDFDELKACIRDYQPWDEAG